MNSEEENFHIPTGAVIEHEGVTQILYITHLAVETPELLHSHIMTILDNHVESWSTTEFSGNVNLKCWNDILEKEHLEPVEDILRQVIAFAQKVTDENGAVSADGNKIVLHASLAQTSEIQDSDLLLGTPEAGETSSGNSGNAPVESRSFFQRVFGFLKR